MAARRAPRKRTIDSGTGLEVRRAVETIAIQPRSGHLTLITRRLYNTLLYHAQQQGKEKSVYRVRLQEVTRDSKFESNNTEILKEHLRKMVDIRVEWNDPGKAWQASALVASVRIEKDERGLVWLEWQYSDAIKQRVLAPEIYTRLSLQFQTLLRSSASLALYEVGLRYSTSPGGLTMRQPWEWWVPVLTGDPDRNENLEYKYFKRDTLRGAIVEINTLTDIDLELVEHRAGKRVIDIQFKVARKRQGALDLADSPIFDTNLVERIVAFGIRPATAQKFYADHEEASIRAAVELTERRMRSKAGTEIVNPAAYFKAALKEGWEPPKSERQALPAPTPAPQVRSEALLKQLRDAYRAQQITEAREMFREQSDEQQDIAIQAFEAEHLPTLPQAIVRAYKRQGLSAPIVSASFFGWLAKHTWPTEPTDADLLAFGLENNLVTSSAPR